MVRRCPAGDSVLHFKKVNLLKTKSPSVPQQRAGHVGESVREEACPWCMIHEVQGRCWPIRLTCQGQGSAGNGRVYAGDLQQ